MDESLSGTPVRVFQSRYTIAIVWAELKGVAKRTEKQNLARMARRKPFFETLRKAVSEEVT